MPKTFFFSSRRRHTSSVSAFLLNRSSDLHLARKLSLIWTAPLPPETELSRQMTTSRSEERRVGKECRSWWARGQLTKGFHRNLGELHVSCRIQQVLVIEGREGCGGWATQQ